MSSHLSSSAVLYGNIDGYRAVESPQTTIPLDNLVTSARPGIVLIDTAENVIWIIELTIPFNSKESFDHACPAHTFKAKYMQPCAVHDLELKHFLV